MEQSSYEWWRTASDAEFIASEAELKQRRNEPLNTELRCYIQAHTMERLAELVKERKSSIDIEVNMALRALLYDQGF